VKSSSICSVARRARWAGLTVLALIAVACASAGPSVPALGELINPSLGPDYSDWLIGAAAKLATPAEVAQFTGLRDDTAAAHFIEDFWSRRNPTPDRRGNPLRQAFEERSGEADHLYSESEVRGRHTDRGATLVLYGPPRKISFEVAPQPLEPPIEVWTYGREHSTGLNGEHPPAEVRFSKRGDLTVFYRGRATRPPRSRMLPSEPSEPPP
jgi:GWxTD domain-containing protein